MSIAHTQPEHMIGLKGLCAALGEFRLRNISLGVERGEYLVVLGPTGAGKTVLLECIAGLVRLQSGRVLLGGNDVTDESPERRRVGYLPQDFGLFPHLRVEQNLVFGLKIRKRMDQAPEIVRRLSEMLGIGHLMRRRPTTLSGGEKQRVALGRALAVDPSVMLLDEPLSSLDTATRDRIGSELKRIHRSQGMTTIHVCHNFEETVRLADRVALMRDGLLLQTGTPTEVLRRPNCLFAAEFVRSENILRGYASPEARGARLELAEGPELHSDTRLSGPVYAAVRPDEIRVSEAGDDPVDHACNRLTAVVTHAEDRGHGYAVRTAGDVELTALVPRRRWQELGDCRGRQVSLTFPAESVHMFPAEDTRASQNTETSELAQSSH